MYGKIKCVKRDRHARWNVGMPLQCGLASFLIHQTYPACVTDYILSPSQLQLVGRLPYIVRGVAHLCVAQVGTTQIECFLNIRPNLFNCHCNIFIHVQIYYTVNVNILIYYIKLDVVCIFICLLICLLERALLENSLTDCGRSFAICVL